MKEGIVVRIRRLAFSTIISCCALAGILALSSCGTTDEITELYADRVEQFEVTDGQYALSALSASKSIPQTAAGLRLAACMNLDIPSPTMQQVSSELDPQSEFATFDAKGLVDIADAIGQPANLDAGLQKSVVDEVNAAIEGEYGDRDLELVLVYDGSSVLTEIDQDDELDVDAVEAWAQQLEPVGSLPLMVMQADLAGSETSIDFEAEGDAGASELASALALAGPVSDADGELLSRAVQEEGLPQDLDALADICEVEPDLIDADFAMVESFVDSLSTETGLFRNQSSASSSWRATWFAARLFESAAVEGRMAATYDFAANSGGAAGQQDPFEALYACAAGSVAGAEMEGLPSKADLEARFSTVDEQMNSETAFRWFELHLAAQDCGVDLTIPNFSDSDGPPSAYTAAAKVFASEIRNDDGGATVNAVLSDEEERLLKDAPPNEAPLVTAKLILERDQTLLADGELDEMLGDLAGCEGVGDNRGIYRVTTDDALCDLYGTFLVSWGLGSSGHGQIWEQGA